MTIARISPPPPRRAEPQPVRNAPPAAPRFPAPSTPAPIARSVPPAQPASRAVRASAARSTRQEQPGPDCGSAANRESLALSLLDFQEDGGQSEDDQGETQAGGTSAAVGPGTGFDIEEFMDLLPTGGDNGIFEVIFPGGETLGVVVDVHPATASFLLVPKSEKLGAFLRGRKMELESGLARRMNRNVKLAVL